MLSNFFKKLFANKKFLSVFCFFILIAIFVPLAFTNAGAIMDAITGTLGAAAESFAAGILGTIAGLLMTVPLFLLNVALDLLNWVTSGNFLVVSFTNFAQGTPGYNHLVATGWGFTRNLANVVLIFGLVIIALSIIMDYQETQAKKALVNFVLVAALINFTPVFCGLIIDLARIIMDLLLKGGAAPTVVTLISEKMSQFNGLSNIPTLVVLCIFCLFSAVVYFLFALLFLVRVAMLWILIILSPIAFSTKVMPQGKMIKKIFPGMFYWDEWWDAFLQWCFLGIPAAIGIWLSNLLMSEIARDPSSIVSAPQGNVLSGTLGLLFAYSLPFIVLVVFFMLTLDSGGSIGKKLKGYTNYAIGGAKGAVAGAAVGAYVGVKEGWRTSRERGNSRTRSIFEAGAEGLEKGTRRSARGAITGGKSEETAFKNWKKKVIGGDSKTKNPEDLSDPAKLEDMSIGDLNKSLGGRDNEKNREKARRSVDRAALYRERTRLHNEWLRLVRLYPNRATRTQEQQRAIDLAARREADYNNKINQLYYYLDYYRA